ncbi:histidine kinase N-terminal 7TM domain-containing diguanylate cyclase [Halalkalibacter akibai]|uniref:GGDEF domain protein n=1 Tax=Halalkalibacter akibai (strain ATCC 43226 / DSM 21942 / CIP 109018 / JCM 9157 / 1139) TaxID=1236973 RepID=W4QTT4_HALA3|nr:histidine kinase N-terminal 7TM domain-containing protein [Halalkalibacter akibai]GAE35013.1 GGDEF domain protein [Halalkalibacter akibai JCM 9157]
MAQEVIPYFIASILSGCLSSFLSVYGFFKVRQAPGGLYFVLSTFMCAIFTFSYAAELASHTLAQIKFWLMFEYFALPFIPTFILLMCLTYLGKKVNRWMIVLLYTLPIITIFIHNTNELHQLYYSSVGLRENSSFPIIELTGGPWFYVHSLYLYTCISVSVLMLLAEIKKAVSFRFRMQLIIMVTGYVVPVVASVFYVNGMSPHGIDLGPVFMSVSFIFHGIALISFQMFNVAPIAREAVFENIDDGVIVLNQQNVIVDFNKAAVQIIPFLNTKMIGKTLKEVLGETSELTEQLTSQKQFDYEYVQNGQTKYLQISFSSVWTKQQKQVGTIIRFADVTERVTLEKQLKYLASTDGLTELLNRTYFLSEVEQIYQNLLYQGGSLSYIMFDIDHFKQINDQYGHEAGDVVLKQVAAIAKLQIREIDRIGRYGGEEFVICLPNTTLLEAEEIADAIRLAISKRYFPYLDLKIGVTSSFGLSHLEFIPGEPHLPIEVLMREADQALYKAKENGRNCVQIYNEVLVGVKA